VTLVKACGLDVGVPAGVMGNSEVGHQNIGAGRIVDQEIVRITKAIGDGEIAGNAVWRAALDRVKTGARSCIFLVWPPMPGCTACWNTFMACCGSPKRRG